MFEVDPFSTIECQTPINQLSTDAIISMLDKTIERLNKAEFLGAARNQDDTEEQDTKLHRDNQVTDINKVDSGSQDGPKEIMVNIGKAFGYLTWLDMELKESHLEQLNEVLRKCEKAIDKIDDTKEMTKFTHFVMASKDFMLDQERCKKHPI